MSVISHFRLQAFSAVLDHQPLTCWRVLDAPHVLQRLDPLLVDRVRRLASHAQSMPLPFKDARLISGFPSADPRQLTQRVPAWQSESGADVLFVGQDWSQDSALAVLLQEPISIDRVGLQRMILALSILALDVHWHADVASAQQVSRLIRYWFMDPETRMHPTALYSLLVDGEASPLIFAGVPMFRDFWVFLDLIRLLSRCSVLDSIEQAALREWFEDFHGWLSAGRQQLLTTPVRGSLLTTYHLLLVSIGAFLGHGNLIEDSAVDLAALLSHQFDVDGAPLHLVWLVPGHHGRLCNLQAWANLAVVFRGLGVDITTLESDVGCCLRGVFENLIGDIVSSWPSLTRASQEELRWLMLIAAMFGDGATEWSRPSVGDLGEAPDLMHPSYGVPPFWRLCLSH